MCSLLLYSFMALVLLTTCTAQSPAGHTVDFHVGVILDMNSPVGRIGNNCLWMAHSDFYSVHADHKTRLVLHSIDSNGSLVDAAAAAFDLLRDVKVDAIIGPQTSTQASFVMDLGERAHVPVISFSATSPSLIHQTPHFLQTAQSDANQVQAIASIIKEFGWRQVVIIYEDTMFGNGIVPYLSNAIQDVKARVSYKSVLPESANDDFISKELQKMMTMEARVFVVHMSQFLGNKLFLKVRELGMMTEGYAWIVSSELMDLFNLVDSDVVEAMQGVLGVRPVIPKSRELQSFAAKYFRTSLQANPDKRSGEIGIFGLWAYDTLWALAKAAEVVGNNGTNVTENEANVNSTKPFSLGVSETGPKLHEALLKTRFTGLAGEFNLVNRQLEQTAYQIVNVVESMARPVGNWTRSGGISRKQDPNVTSSYSTSMEKFKSIIWPGDSVKRPRGWEVKKLRIAVPQKLGFNELLHAFKDPETNKIVVTGYYKDVFEAVMKKLPYNISIDYVLYPLFNPDGTSAGTYDELVYQVSLKVDSMNEYDGALGDITVTANRSNYADFTMPYEEGGVACIVPIKYEYENGVFTFLEPLSKDLWLTTAIFYIATAVVIWILSKRILHRSSNWPGQHPGMICYFPFFPGEGIESNLVCLVLVTWAFVASLLNSTYTASLSSRLTVARLQPTITNVTQLIKNGDYVGCQEGSFLVNYLKKLFNESKISKYKSVDDMHEALSLRNKSISAYCDVLPHIKHILSQSCGKYMMIDPIYRTDGFALPFPKDFPAISDISKAILQLIEDGTILEMQQRFLRIQECTDPDKDRSLAKVSLRSFLVLFAITGFVTLTCLVVSLLIQLHYERSFLQRILDFVAIIRSRFLAPWICFRSRILAPWICFRSRILALWIYFKRNDPPSLPRNKNTRDEIMQVEMGCSS